MNFPSIALSSLSPSYFKEAFLRPLTVQERNICIVAAAALSVLALCYYCVGCCCSWEVSSPPHLGPPTLQVPFMTPLPAVVSVDDLKQKINSCQATANLYAIAETNLKNFKGLPLRVETVAPGMVFKTGAICDWFQGAIFISSKLSEDQAFIYFIFELANMTQAAEFAEIWQSVQQGELSREEYAYAMESVEYKSTLLHTTTVKDAIAEMGEEWRKYDFFHQFGLDEALYYDTQISAGHVEYYLNYYDRIMALKPNVKAIG